MSTEVKTVVVDRAGPERPVIVEKQSVAVNILVRAARTFLQVFLALMAGAIVIPAVLPPELQGMILVPIARQALVAAQLAGLAAIMAGLQNVLELLSKLDATNPELRG